MSDTTEDPLELTTTISKAKGHDMGSMKMWFHSCNHSTILFSWWTTSTWQGMLGSCIAIIIAAALYEGLKVLREWLLHRALVTKRYATNGVAVPSEDPGVAVTTGPSFNNRCHMLSLAHLVQTILHILQVVISYLLMLVVMTYNTWLFISVAIGAGLGYFLFSWRRTSIIDANEHCH